MSAIGKDIISCFGVPDPLCFILRSRGNAAAIRRPCYRIHRNSIPIIGRQDSSGTSIPHLHPLNLRVSRGDALAIGGPGHHVHPIRMTIISEQDSSCASIPHLHCSLIRTRSDVPAIGAPGYRTHTPGRIAIGENSGSSGGIPYLHRSITRTRGNVPAIRRPCYRVCTTDMTAIGEQSGSYRRLWLTGLFQSVCKSMYTCKALMRIFGQSHHHYLFNLRRNLQVLLEGWGRSRQVLRNYLPISPIEWPFPAQPLVDNDPQSILITGWARLALQLLRRHIGHRTSLFLCIEGLRPMGYRGNTKVAEQYFVVR